MDSYFNELNTIWEELKLFRSLPHCSCGMCQFTCFEKFVTAQEKDYTFKFLNGLNDTFSGIWSQIIIMKPFPSLDEVYNMVLSEESQRHYNSNVVDILIEASTMAVQRNRYRNPDAECSYYKKKGHTRERCFKLIGYSTNWRSNSNSHQSNINANSQQ